MSRSVLNKLSAANDAVAKAVDTELVRVLSGVNFADPVSAQAALFDAIPPLVDQWGDVAAAAAAEWFEEFRVSEGISGAFRAQMAGTVPVEQVNARLGYATRESGHLFAGQIPELTDFLSLMVNEYVMRPGHETISQNALRDNAAYARVPEAGACDFCIMLASRGFVYSERSVLLADDGNKFHANCRCHGMPVWDDTKARVEYGYSPEALYDQYLERRSGNTDQNN